MATQEKTAYVVVDGVTLEDGTHIEAGKPYTGPDEAVKWLRECGAIKPAPKKRGAK